MGLGLGSSLSKTRLTSTTGIITDNLVMKHNYAAGSVVPVSDGAAYFDGSNAEISMGSDSSLDVGTNEFTVTCWFNPSTITSHGAIVSKGKGLQSAPYDGFGWAVTLYGSGSSIYFDVYAGVHGSGVEDIRLNAISTPALPSANRWYHVAVTRETSGANSIYRIYIDGVLSNSETATDGGANDALAADGTVSDAANDFKLGENAGNLHDYTGYICNVGYWIGGYLTQAQVKSIMWKNYAGLTSTEKTNLVSWWNLDEQTATDGTAGSGGVKDYHGSNHGTLA